MAVPTGSGTEVLKAHHFDLLDGDQTLILGVQHHTYTVLSTICYCRTLNATADFGFLKIVGYGSHVGNSAETMIIARFNIQVGETFVWNDKFSFFGGEPVAFTEPLSTAAEQVAIAAQGSAVVQYYQMGATHAGDDFDVTVTFLDQDWT